MTLGATPSPFRKSETTPHSPGRALRPGVRARLVRRRVRRAAERDPLARDDRARADARSRTSSTAARPAPTRSPATAPGCCCSSPTSSSAAVIAEELPPAGAYGVGGLLPARGRRGAPGRARADPRRRGRGRGPARDLPGATSRWSSTTIGDDAPARSRPIVRQLVVAASDELAGDRDAFERKLYVIRRVAEIAAGPDLVIPSFSARTIVYKGMLMAPAARATATPTCSTSG